MKQKPARSNYTILKQICEYVPGHLINSLAKKHGVDKASRTFKPWSHIFAMIYAQVSHAISLNDICDALRNQSKALKQLEEQLRQVEMVFLMQTKLEMQKWQKSCFGLCWNIFKTFRQILE